MERTFIIRQLEFAHHEYSQGYFFIAGQEVFIQFMKTQLQLPGDNDIFPIYHCTKTYREDNGDNDLITSNPEEVIEWITPEQNPTFETVLEFCFHRSAEGDKSFYP